MSLVVLQPCVPRGTSDPACRKQPIRSPLTLLFAPPTLCPCVHPVHTPCSLPAVRARRDTHSRQGLGLRAPLIGHGRARILPGSPPLASEACGRLGSGPEIHKQKGKESASQLCCWHRRATAGSSQAGRRKSQTPPWGPAPPTLGPQRPHLPRAWLQPCWHCPWPEPLPGCACHPARLPGSAPGPSHLALAAPEPSFLRASDSGHQPPSRPWMSALVCLLPTSSYERF